MDSDGSENDNYSDNDLDDVKHAKLVENVLGLSNKPHVKKPSRTEPTIKVSEFDLVKSVTGNKGSVHLADLTKSLKQRANHVKIGNKVCTNERMVKTLKKPLEKIQADRIRRTVAYESTKNHLERWDAIVTSNRAAATLSFPLKENNEVVKNPNPTSEWRLKSDLEKEVDKLRPPTEVFNIDTESKFPLTMEEIMEKRKEVAKLRAHQSYKEAKARRQNKIKSKKYHRIQKRQKAKQQLKEFELLQQTDPEAALLKLEEIEKARAEERGNLRHKSTGKWAKNKQIRAKYDKESRQVLAQQLGISRDLTQKIKINEDSDSENEETAAQIPPSNSNNPWVNNAAIKTSGEIDNFVSGYRKYWEDKNKGLENNKQDLNNDLLKNNEVNLLETLKKSNGKVKITKIKSKVVKNKKVLRKIKTQSTSQWDVTISDEDSEIIQSSENSDGFNEDSDQSNEDSDESNKDSNESNEDSDESNEESDDSNKCKDSEENKNSIEYELNKLSSKIKEKMALKLQELSQEFDNKPKKVVKGLSEKNKTKQVSNFEKLAIPTQKRKTPQIDEQLLENGHTNNKKVEINQLKSVLNADINKSTDIDPNKYLHVKTVELNTDLPDLFGVDDNEENLDQRGVIAEAFENDDIIEDFSKDKQDEADKGKPKDIDLNLPGWGEWGGKNIIKSVRKRKRFIVKFPAKMPRRDDNKGDLIINEDGNEKARPHLVSELPFPFTTVKDFEASVRAPIGSTFVPETAFRKLTQPALKTKMGAIINPMNESVLLKKKK